MKNILWDLMILQDWNYITYQDWDTIETSFDYTRTKEANLSTNWNIDA